MKSSKHLNDLVAKGKEVMILGHLFQIDIPLFSDNVNEHFCKIYCPSFQPRKFLVLYILHW